MAQTDAKLKIRPEILEKLSAGETKLWSAVHKDDTDNRINGDEVLEASTYGIGVGLLTAGEQWLRKLFRNRGKTKEDLAAEKEASRINRTSDALEEMLLEYFRAAREGRVEEEPLQELIDTLEETEAYYRAGKLRVTGEQELSEMRRGIGEFTAAIAERYNAQPLQETDSSGRDEFFRIRELLIHQKHLLGQPDTD